MRDRAEESVKLQQPGDKSFPFSLSLPASANEDRAKPVERGADSGCLLSPQLPASLDQQASNLE